MIKTKRVYDKPATTDGLRVLVDRLWPRGVSKAEAHLDVWLKEIAPSSELRTWFDHRPERFEDFSKRYIAELAHNPALAEMKRVVAERHTVTLLYAAKNPAVNHAIVLQKFLREHGRE